MDLTTIARVKQYGNITDTDHDAFLTVLVTAVSAAIEQFLDRHAESKSRTEYHDVLPGQSSFWLKGYPITSIASMTNDIDWDFTTGDIDSGDFIHLGSDDDGRIDVIKGLLLIGDRALKIVYTGGMGTDTTDFISNFPDIATAADQQVLFQFQRRDKLGEQSSTIQGTAVNLQPAITLLPIVKQILMPHKRKLLFATGG